MYGEANSINEKKLIIMMRKSIAFVHRHRDFNLSNINVNFDSSFY